MRKRFYNCIIVLCVLIIILLLGLITHVLTSTDTQELTAYDLQMQDSLIVSRGEPEERVFINYDSDFKDSVKSYLSDFTHIEVKQTIKTADLMESYNSSTETTIDLDLLNNRSYVTINTKTPVQETTEELFEDVETGTHMYKSDDEWLIDNSVTSLLSFDINSYENCYDFYEHILNDVNIEYGSIGEKTDNRVYFINDSDASPRDLSRVDYDKLGTKKVSMIFEDRDGVYVPISNIVSVTFYIKDVEYNCVSSINFIDINNDELEIP